MTYDPDRHHRRSIRLQGYDYAQAGTYFVTVCAQERLCLFGDVIDGDMALNEYGGIVAEGWRWLSEQYDYVALDEWVIMPNHFHGILVLRHPAGRGGSRTAPTGTAARKSVGRLVGAFKTVTAKRINERRQTPGAPVWQRNYYEHVIRDEPTLNLIREYIFNNPLQWSLDRENPAATGVPVITQRQDEPWQV